MSIRHHPTDDTLLRLAAGKLNAGLAALASGHAAGCAQCHGRVAAFEAVGGAVLDAQPCAPLIPTGFADVLARLGNPPAPQAPRKMKQYLPPDLVLPSMLEGCDTGPWLWLGRGVRYSRLRMPGVPEANVLLLRVAANRPIPRHTHSAHELTLILRGGYSDSTGQYGPGDTAEADATVLHQPRADAEGCTCLVAFEGRLLLDGWLGRWQRRLGRA
jgi:putative transcriptional regulator